MITREEIRIILREIVVLLANNNLHKIYENDVGKRVNVEDMRFYLEDYGGKITTPNKDFFNQYHISKTNDINVCRVAHTLWVDGEKSDLMIHLTLEKRNEKVNYINDGIYVP